MNNVHTGVGLSDLQRITGSPGVRTLHDAAGTRRVEALAMAALPAHALMQRAGLAVARLALALAPHARRVRVAVGPGNNGGDGLEAAVHLLHWGKQVDVVWLADEANLPDDARHALMRARAAGIEIHGSAHPCGPLQRGDIAIDGLLGIGAKRAPSGAIAECIRSLNRLTCSVLAIDLPSGLNADTGQPLGDDCVIAQHTLALLTLKPGLHTGAGREHSGTVWLDQLGSTAQATESGQACLHGAPSESSIRPSRRHGQHKGSFGDVAIIGGAPGMVGAAFLAGRAALAGGAGRVYLSLLGAVDEGTTHDPLRPELMFRPAWWNGPPEVLAQTTVVCGCGGGERVRTALPRLLSLSARLVLDADALNQLAGDAGLVQQLRARARRGNDTVLTPHPLEAARLLGCSTREVQTDRLAAARALAEKFQAVVVLKGSGSVIAAPDGLPIINGSGNAALASPGTGDVLAGWLGALWAQADGQPALQVAALAVAEHGAAAEPQPGGPLRAGDLIERLWRGLRADAQRSG